MIGQLITSIMEDAIRGLSGPLGIRIRRKWYRWRLKRCGKRLVIEPGVHLVRPDQISLGSDVWLDRHVVLIAGPPANDAEIEVLANPDAKVEIGEIVIGNSAHIGIGTIIQGHGGVEIGDCFTTSPSVKIYSFSNDYRRSRAGTMRRKGARLYCLQTPVHIGSNVWIGINSVIVGHSIGSDTFVKPATVLSGDVPDNSIVSGTPGRRVGDRFAGACYNKRVES